MQQHEQGQGQGRQDDRSPGASGHPEPGSQHDDGKTETVAEGPRVRRVDGVPGAHGEGETAGGVLTEAEEEGKAIRATEGGVDARPDRDR